MKPWEQASVIEYSLRLLDSFFYWTGKKLIHEKENDLKTDVEKARALFLAPQVVVSHNAAADPILTYGNQKALELWEMTWNSFIQTPSRLTAEIINRPDRKQFLEEVNEKGFSNDYSGVRISSSGKRFEICQAVVWNVLDLKNKVIGQAATFDQVKYLS